MGETYSVGTGREPDAAATAPDLRLRAFPPLVDDRSRLLILGSMPSEASLRRQQYYGHPQNAFWPIVFDLWQTPQTTDYGQRTRFLLDHQIALWDVLASCTRQGSADRAIRQAQPNDFAAFFAAWPHLRWVCFNGQAAAALFDRLVLKANGWTALTDVRPDLQGCLLCSTSPAHAIRYPDKLTAWHQVCRLLGQCLDRPEAEGLT